MGPNILPSAHQRDIWRNQPLQRLEEGCKPVPEVSNTLFDLCCSSRLRRECQPAGQFIYSKVHLLNTVASDPGRA